MAAEELWPPLPLPLPRPPRALRRELRRFGMSVEDIVWRRQSEGIRAGDADLAVMETVQGPLMDVASDVGQPLQAVAGHDCGALQY